MGGNQAIVGIIQPIHATLITKVTIALESIRLSKEIIVFAKPCEVSACIRLMVVPLASAEHTYTTFPLYYVAKNFYVQHVLFINWEIYKISKIYQMIESNDLNI